MGGNCYVTRNIAHISSPLPPTHLPHNASLLATSPQTTHLCSLDLVSFRLRKHQPCLRPVFPKLHEAPNDAWRFDHAARLNSELWTEGINITRRRHSSQALPQVPLHRIYSRNTCLVPVDPRDRCVTWTWTC